MASKSKKTSLKTKVLKTRKHRTPKVGVLNDSTPLKEIKKVSLLKKILSFIFNK